MKRSVMSLIDRVVICLLGDKCPKCGSRNHKSGHGYWTRGYNNYCRQACGDSGWRCYDCGRIEWDQTLEQYQAKLPDWCDAGSR